MPESAPPPLGREILFDVPELLFIMFCACWCSDRPSTQCDSCVGMLFANYSDKPMPTVKNFTPRLIKTSSSASLAYNGKALPIQTSSRGSLSKIRDGKTSNLLPIAPLEKATAVENAWP